MPWRVPPDQRKAGVKPDPYRVWLSEIMLQQTTVATVGPYFRAFTETWPDVHALADAADADVMAAWAGLGYYARARNLLRCARVVSRDLYGVFPDTIDGLLALPGVGPYTAAAVSAIAFDQPSTVLDGNVERVMARLFAETDPLPVVKGVLRKHAASLTPTQRPGDYAQAVMDLGATICTPRRPACALCPWNEGCCARDEGLAEQLPAKQPKSAKPTRRGMAWAALNAQGEVLTVTRPPKGLLGGMLALPSTDFSGNPKGTAPIDADWQVVGEVRHTFTHFHLILEIRAAMTQIRTDDFMTMETAEASMPTVFAKACRLVRASGLYSAR